MLKSIPQAQPHARSDALGSIREEWLPTIIIVALIAPSLVWIYSDNSVWPFDQAYYGEVTFKLAHSWAQGPIAWLQAMAAAIGTKPPLLVWIAQIMVPLSDLLGGAERALLLVNLAVNTATLCLIYAISRRLGASRAASLAGVLFCGGASLFVGMAHQFFVEPLQALAVTGLMWLAVRADTSSLLKLSGTTLLVVAMNFAVKSSSAGFVGPFLFYIAIVRLATKGSRRDPVTRGDWVLLALGAASMAAAAAWYMTNYAAMLQHIILSTVGPEALLYGSQQALGPKLIFWIQALMRSVTPWKATALGLSAVVCAGLVVAGMQVLRKPWRSWIKAAIASHLLYALALLGTVAAGLLVYSLQINEETRFLTPMIPILGVLLAWSLKTLTQRWLDGLTLACLALSAVTVEGAAHGMRVTHADFTHWLVPYNSDRGASDRLTEIVTRTCGAAESNRYNIIGTEQSQLNANSASFYAAKLPVARYNCFYTSLGYAEQDLEKAYRRIDQFQAPYVVTLAPENLPVDADPFNRVSRSVSERLQADPNFALAAEIGSGLRIYRHR